MFQLIIFFNIHFLYFYNRLDVCSLCVLFTSYNLLIKKNYNFFILSKYFKKSFVSIICIIVFYYIIVILFNKFYFFNKKK